METAEHRRRMNREIHVRIWERPELRLPLGDSTLPVGLIRAARAIVGGDKAVTRPKPVEQPTRIWLSIYRGTVATHGFAKPAVSSPWAHNVLT